MARFSHRSPTAGDLALSRTVTSVAVGAAMALIAASLLTADDTPGGRIADLVAVFVAFAFSVGLIALKLRGDFILGLFGYWWPFLLPRSDEMARSIRQEAFGFAYLVILGAVLAVLFPVTAALAISDPFAAWLAGHVSAVTTSDALACLLAVVIILAILPQAYLAWTLKSLDPLDGDETILEHAS